MKKINFIQDEKQMIFIDKITSADIQNFVTLSLNEFGSIEKLIEANQVANAVFQLLEKKKLATNIRLVETLIASALLHNLFYDKDDWTTLFKARQILNTDMISPQISDAVFQTIEAQLGEDSPVLSIAPKPGPTELFAIAIWTVKEYKK